MGIDRSFAQPMKGVVVAEYTGASGSTAIDPSATAVKLSKSTAGAYTLAAPGERNVGTLMTIYTSTNQAHVITVTGLVGGNTLTYATAIGNSCTLLAVDAVTWVLVADYGVTKSTV